MSDKPENTQVLPPQKIASVPMRQEGRGSIIVPASTQEVMDFAQLMAKAGPAVPPAFQNNPGLCVAIIIQAVAWEMSPFAVAQKSYIVPDKAGLPRLSYEAQLVAAVVNTRGPFRERPRLEYDGTGDQMACTVTATIRGEARPRILTTPRIANIAVKNSSLWKSDPEQQLAYYALRAFARRVCPEVLLGVYTPDEAREMEPIREAEGAAPGPVPPRPKRSDFKAPKIETHGATVNETAEESRSPTPAEHDPKSHDPAESEGGAPPKVASGPLPQVSQLDAWLSKLAAVTNVRALDALSEDVTALLNRDDDKGSLSKWDSAVKERFANMTQARGQKGKSTSI
jgi:hypothetical protein